MSEKLAEILYPLLTEMTITMKSCITAQPRPAYQATWVQGSRTEIPCNFEVHIDISMDRKDVKKYENCYTIVVIKDDYYDVCFLYCNTRSIL